MQIRVDCVTHSSIDSDIFNMHDRLFIQNLHAGREDGVDTKINTDIRIMMNGMNCEFLSFIRHNSLLLQPFELDSLYTSIIIKQNINYSRNPIFNWHKILNKIVQSLINVCSFFFSSPPETPYFSF